MKKQICVLFASPRETGNTAQLLQPVLQTLKESGHEISEYDLYKMNIQPCLSCRNCQKDWHLFGCVHQDDMQQIFDTIMKSDMIILASPIYSWYCTPPMKAVMDRLVYGMNKYYGDEVGPSLWQGKQVAIVTTCGYRPEQGADLFEEGIKRYCKHSKLVYEGMLAERFLGYKTVFMDEQKRAHACQFGERLSN